MEELKQLKMKVVNPKGQSAEGLFPQDSNIFTDFVGNLNQPVEDVRPVSLREEYVIHYAMGKVVPSLGLVVGKYSWSAPGEIYDQLRDEPYSLSPKKIESLFQKAYMSITIDRCNLLAVNGYYFVFGSTFFNFPIICTKNVKEAVEIFSNRAFECLNKENRVL